jgi:hypothetical protein
MVEDVMNWEKNGYIDSDGKRVRNRFLIGKVHHLIEEARRGERFGTRFWLVDSEENEEGVPLTDSAFDSARKTEEEDNEEDDEPSFRPCLGYRENDAPGNVDARELARRLRFRLHDEDAGANTDTDAAIEIAAVMRRLVITGEDRPQNFQYLFGAQWAELNPLWAEKRLDVLKEFTGPSKFFSDIYDADTPFLRPRQLDALEEEKVSQLEATKSTQEESKSELHRQ